VDETYRILGREHQADLEREARKVALAAAVRRNSITAPAARTRRRVVVAVTRLAALLS
jgi:hypothetical protein